VKHHFILIFWPSFVVAGIANALFFTFFDPADFVLFGPFGLSRLTAYSTGFFILWALSAASSAITVYLEHARHHIR
jgi:hypothetical protein